MKKLILISALLFSFNGWAEDNERKSIMFDDAIVRIKIPESFSNEAILGKKIFESNCIECHGKNAVGRKKIGPPLVHKIYEPSHHNDMTFYRAVEMGVRGHHWMFGDMAAVENVTRDEVKSIKCNQAKASEMKLNRMNRSDIKSYHVTPIKPQCSK